MVRLAYLASDRVDAQYEVSALIRTLKEPQQSSWSKLCRACHYLRGTSDAEIHRMQPDKDDDVVWLDIWSDSDWSGKVLRFLSLALILDSYMTRGICKREGVDEVEHLSCKALLVQQLVTRGIINVTPTLRLENKADLSTKVSPVATLRYHSERCGLKVVEEATEKETEDETVSAISVARGSGSASPGALGAVIALLSAQRTSGSPDDTACVVGGGPPVPQPECYWCFWVMVVLVLLVALAWTALVVCCTLRCAVPRDPRAPAAAPADAPAEATPTLRHTAPAKVEIRTVQVQTSTTFKRDWAQPRMAEARVDEVGVFIEVEGRARHVRLWSPALAVPPG